MKFPLQADTIVPHHVVVVSRRRSVIPPLRAILVHCRRARKFALVLSQSLCVLAGNPSPDPSHLPKGRLRGGEPE